VNRQWTETLVPIVPGALDPPSQLGRDASAGVPGPPNLDADLEVAVLEHQRTWIKGQFVVGAPASCWSHVANREITSGNQPTTWVAEPFGSVPSSAPAALSSSTLPSAPVAAALGYRSALSFIQSRIVRPDLNG